MSTSKQETIAAQLRAYEADMGFRGYPRRSRFDRIVFGRNWIDRQITGERRSGRVEHIVVGARGKDRYLPSEFVNDPQFSVDVMLAPRGESIYGASLFNPTPGVYQVRAAITQHHAGTLFQGCQLKWLLPAGWSWADGHSTFTYAEFISNPLVITRLARYSSGTAGWKVVVVEWFRP